MDRRYTAEPCECGDLFCAGCNEPEVTGEETIVDAEGKKIEFVPDSIGLKNMEDFIRAGGNPLQVKEGT